MKLVYTSDNLMIAGQIQGLLESNQINSFMKNVSLTGGIGELPANECWPEVWVHNDNDETSALELIQSYLKQQPSNSPWQCQCGETIEGQYTECWNCGHAV